MIRVLSDETINKIAAGEVVERPLNVVKELVENAIDAAASAITVEIKGGGIDYIRVTDNGKGIPQGEVRTAFLRHATSKIASEEDLHYLNTLGFRGEALASIAAVSQVGMMTKTESQMMGTRLCIEGGVETEFTEIGAPEGTTIIVRNLFYNVPPRKKFLHSATAEGAAIIETMQHMALSMPGLSFKVVVNGSVKFMTAGNGDLKEVIYRIYGKSTSDELIPIQVEKDGIKVEGYLGRPVIARANRGDENYFINHRYIRSKEITKGVEEGYKAFLMMHRFPFCVLHLSMDTTALDVNIHPNKMQVRMADPETMVRLLSEEVHDSLLERNLIPDIKEQEEEIKEKIKAPEPYEARRIASIVQNTDTNDAFTTLFEDKDEPKEEEHFFQKQVLFSDDDSVRGLFEEPVISDTSAKSAQEDFVKPATNPHAEVLHVEKPEQYTMFENEFFTEDAKDEFEVIGQVFDTFWIISLRDKFYYMDQHAAHEKVKYEEFMKKFKEGKLQSQNLLPPCIIQLKPAEYVVFEKNKEAFEHLSFEIEDFGSDAIAIRSMPTDLFGYSCEELFMDVLEELQTVYSTKSLTTVEERIATRACKAAIKGNTKLTKESAKKLIEMLFTLENPYQCPHGRPTLIAVSKYELEKMFKRIV